MNTVLLLCTANRCRSVMASGLLSARLAACSAPAEVTSAGMRGQTGRRPSDEAIAVMAARGIDVAGHRSRMVTVADLAGADLVIGLTREHVRHCAVMLPGVWQRAFTLREIVRRGRAAGPRGAGEPLGDWLARAACGRGRRDLLGHDRLDDVADPFGGPLAGYQQTADLLDRLARDLARLCWPA
jgi:protein-tyrosine phosphatase